MEELYVLQLQGGKYYVGKTTDMNRRYEQHKSGKGSSWTSTYRPVKILEVRPVKDEHDENNTTKDLMKKYGIDNVRGGSYTQVVLSKDLESALQTELRGVSDACFKCGEKGHFARDCDTEEDVAYECEDCGAEFESMAKFNRHTCRSSRQSGSCYRCGRSSHWANECYASRHVRGYDLSDDSDDEDDDSDDEYDSESDY